MRVYSDLDTSTLKGVYLVAMEGLRSTHVVDEAALDFLADAVLATYVGSGVRFPLTREDVADLANASLDTLLESHGNLLAMKHGGSDRARQHPSLPH